MSFRKYAEYKESGVVWLDEVPEHWEVKRLKFCVQLADQKMKADREKPLPYVGLENIQSWTGKLLGLDPDVVPTSAANRFGKGMTLFGKLRPYLAKACNPDFEGLCSTELLVFKSASFDRRLLLYLLLTDGFIKTVDSSTYGAKMPRANWDFIGNCIVPVPPLEEQKQIAAFLDKETTKIDALVEKQEQLITLLREKRQAIISHAVTRGLNPNVKMKDSGIEWLGEVPEHWEMGHLRWFISIKSGEGLSNSQFSKETLDEDSYPVIGGNGTMGYSKHFNTTQKAFAIGRVGALCGNVHFLKEKCWITDNALKISKWEGFNDSYFEYMLRAANLNQYANQSAQPLITGEQVKALPVPRLPLEEQKQIAAFLNEETTKIDTLIEKCETAIELLKERRTALISAAVTGKIDVRNTI